MSVVSKYTQDSLSRNVRNGLPAILVYIFADRMVGTKNVYGVYSLNIHVTTPEIVVVVIRWF